MGPSIPSPDVKGEPDVGPEPRRFAPNLAFRAKPPSTWPSELGDVWGGWSTLASFTTKRAPLRERGKPGIGKPRHSLDPKVPVFRGG